MIMNHSPLCKSFLIHGLLSFNLVKYLKTDWTDTGPIIIKLLAKSSFRFNSDLYGLIHVNSKCGPLWQPASQATVAASQQRGSHYSDKSRPASQPDTTPQRPQRSKEPATSQAASSHPASRQRTDCSLRKSAFSCTVWCTSQRLRALACFYRNILGFCVVGKISWLSCWEKPVTGNEDSFPTRNDYQIVTGRVGMQVVQRFEVISVSEFVGSKFKPFSSMISL